MKRLFIGTWRRSAAALVGAGVLSLAASSAAQAEFKAPYNTQCSGGLTAGIATGLEGNIARDWNNEFQEEDHTSPLSCAKQGPGTFYKITTTPKALEALGAANGTRDAEYAFAGSEELPTLAQWLKIDLGNEPGKNSGLIREIPVASTAIVPLVHFPAGCSIPAKEATGDGRFTVSNAELEKVYAGEVATWGELLPDIEASCANLPIKRVVPAGAEGTASIFKQWLGTVAPHAGWNSLGSAEWPNDSGATATVRSTEGDRGETEMVAETNGSVGVSSLPSARSEGFGVFSPSNPRRNGQGLFWLSVSNGTGEQVQPTRDPNSGTDNVKGANCDAPTFNDVPSGYDTTVTPIWRGVSAVGSTTGWPICTLAYFMAWDDASTVYGNTESAESKQRTVKDFLAYDLSPAGQTEAMEQDYSPLPAGILADAQEGARRVGWEKTPGSEEGAESSVRAQITAAERHLMP